MPVIISCQSLSKSYSSRPLFRDISFGIDEKDRLGLSKKTPTPVDEWELKDGKLVPKTGNATEILNKLANQYLRLFEQGVLQHEGDSITPQEVAALQKIEAAPVVEWWGRSAAYVADKYGLTEKQAQEFLDRAEQWLVGRGYAEVPTDPNQKTIDFLGDELYKVAEAHTVPASTTK